MARQSDRLVLVSDDTAEMVLVCLDGVWVPGTTVKTFSATIIFSVQLHHSEQLCQPLHLGHIAVNESVYTQCEIVYKQSYPWRTECNFSDWFTGSLLNLFDRTSVTATSRMSICII